MSHPLTEEVLTVEWHIPDPPLPAKHWKTWDGGVERKGDPLEERLCWPKGTLSILEQAFSEQLPRGTGWIFEDSRDAQAFSYAARVFRRGVAQKGAGSKVQSGSYDIRLVNAWNWPDILPAHSLGFIDKNLMKAWKIPAQEQLIPLHLDEAGKTLASVAMIIELALAREAEIGSSGPWTIIGGGILADTVAFAAALLGRGFRLVPTTLLAMLDACVGGKTGVNFPPYGKNQIGLFAFPKEVLTSTAWLKTLPQRERASGLSESFKHALLIGDPELAASLSHLNLDLRDLHLFLKRLVQLKVDVVMKDPSEQGLRATLNLGHTLAHAIERISHAERGEDPILHGEAVGVGLLFCLWLSHDIGHLPSSTYESMRRLMIDSPLLLQPKDLQRHLATKDLADPQLIEELLRGIKQDKKMLHASGTEWVLLRGWGEVASHQDRFTVTVSDEDFRMIYRKFITEWSTCAS